jgi:hypothetical protein
LSLFLNIYKRRVPLFPNRCWICHDSSTVSSEFHCVSSDFRRVLTVSPCTHNVPVSSQRPLCPHYVPVSPQFPCPL